MIRSLIAAIYVAFPAENVKLPAVGETYFIGSVASNEVDLASQMVASDKTLTVNGERVDVYRTGAFITMVPVTSGVNTVEVKWGGETFARKFRVAAPTPPPVITQPAKPRDVRADLGLPAEGELTDPIPTNRPLSEIRVMIDPGHGGSDTGARGPHGTCEKDANLLVAKAIRSAFERIGVNVSMTRDDDRDVKLYDRPKKAIAEKADLFISVHHNSTAANRDPRLVRHTVAYGWTSNGVALASSVQKYLAPTIDSFSPGLTIADRGGVSNSLAVCRNPVVPSCLLEVDFINLPEGEEASFSAERAGKTARAVVCGFLDWLAF